MIRLLYMILFTEACYSKALSSLDASSGDISTSGSLTSPDAIRPCFFRQYLIGAGFGSANNSGMNFASGLKISSAPR